MQSRAALGRHPLHPALVTLPIGAFFITLVADIVYLRNGDPGWYRAAFLALATGLIAAIPAAVAGLIDFFGVGMDAAAKRLALWHLGMNVVALALDALSLFLRSGEQALAAGRFG